MLIPKAVTCLPTFDASLVCHLTSSVNGRRLGGKPGGLLYVEPAEMDVPTREAALQGWSKWLVQHDHNKNKSSLSSFAKHYLKLGFLFGEPEFGLSPEVALPMYLNEPINADYVTIESKEIGKQLACTAAGGLYTTGLNSGATAAATPDAQWKCEWHTPEICCIISTEQGMRINCQQDPVPLVQETTDGQPFQSSSVTVNLVPAHSTGTTTSHWRLLEHGDGTIAIATHDESYVLGDNWQGSVTLSSPEPGPRPHWVVRKQSGRGVWLQSAVTKRFLTIENGGFIMKDEPEPNSLFSFEPVHESKFTLSNAKHAKAKNADLSDCLIKVFDNGNVIIKRDGQFFGECHWKDTFVGIGFGDYPFVWNFEPTLDGSIRIAAKTAPADKKYLGYDGSAYTLDTPSEDDDSNYLWNIQAADKKLTIGMRYGLLPKSILHQASQQWPRVQAFRPTLAMEGRFQRPFANWRAWPLENEGPTATNNEYDNPASVAPAPLQPEPVADATQAASLPVPLVSDPPQPPAVPVTPPAVELPTVVHEVPQAQPQPVTPPPEPLVVPPLQPEPTPDIVAETTPSEPLSNADEDMEQELRFLNADQEKLSESSTPSTEWPEKYVSKPVQPVTMNGRVVNSDGNTLGQQSIPIIKTSEQDEEEPRGPSYLFCGSPISAICCRGESPLWLTPTTDCVPPTSQPADEIRILCSVNDILNALVFPHIASRLF